MIKDKDIVRAIPTFSRIWIVSYGLIAAFVFADRSRLNVLQTMGDAEAALFLLCNAGGQAIIYTILLGNWRKWRSSRR